MSLTTAIFSGGPHDGQHTGRPDEPLPERLFAITWDDHSRYARAGIQTDPDTGETVLAMRYDPDGSLTRAAMIDVGLHPDDIDCPKRG